MQIVPLIQYPNQELMCILDNQNCTIRVTVRSGYTFLDLRVDDTVIREGQLCDPWSWVLATPNDFKGNFMMIDTARTIATQERAQYEGLGDRWVLYYFTARLQEIRQVENAYTNVKLGSKRRTGVKQAPEASGLWLGRESGNKWMDGFKDWLKGGK